MTMRDLSFDQSVWADFMRKYFLRMKALGITEAASADVFYGFRCTDVATVHFHKHGEGEGCWFRLKDGRVFASHGIPSNPDPTLYASDVTH